MNSTKCFDLSIQIMDRSYNVFPGGVNSPVRSFKSVGGTPIVFSHGKGKHLYDVDNNHYVDFCSSWGPLILGYSHPSVVKALHNQIEKAVSFGAPTALELDLGEKVKNLVPGIDLLRFVNSGTEATMSAIRAARSATGRDKFIKFEGCYHGHANEFLVKSGSGLATLGAPSSAGVPAKTVEDTLVAVFNDEQGVSDLFAQYDKQIAAIIIEPVAANMGLVAPNPGFLQFLRDICTKHGTVLIFDEVMTGFRLSLGGAAEYFGVTPDMWIFGKIIGGGLPAAAYGGKREIMQHISPLGKAYQAGTLSGNPLAMVAGLATLSELERLQVIPNIERKGQILDSLVLKYLSAECESHQVKYTRVASFFCFFFGTSKIPQNFTEVQNCNMNLFNFVYHNLLDKNIYLGPSGYEVGFLSYCHEEEDLEHLVKVIKESVVSWKKNLL